MEPKKTLSEVKLKNSVDVAEAEFITCLTFNVCCAKLSKFNSRKNKK